MKVLYLEGDAATEVRLEAPAIVVRQSNTSDRIYPIERLGRVVSNARVTWQARALLALARASVPVVFHGEQGEIVAKVIGDTLERAGLVDRLQAILEHPEGQRRYLDWVAHHRHRLGQDARNRKNPDEALPRYLQTNLEALLLESLGAYGVGAGTPILTGAVVDLPNDLSDIVGAYIRLAWSVRSKRWRTASGGNRRWQVTLFESLRDRIEPFVHELLHHLDTWTIEVLDELR